MLDLHFVPTAESQLNSKLSKRRNFSGEPNLKNQLTGGCSEFQIRTSGVSGKKNFPEAIITIIVEFAKLPRTNFQSEIYAE